MNSPRPTRRPLNHNAVLLMREHVMKVGGVAAPSPAARAAATHALQASPLPG